MWKNPSNYVSPYDIGCPYDVIVLYNPSSHANNVATTDLLNAWPSLRIVQVCQEGRLPVVGVSDQFIIPKGSWGDMEVFQQHYQQYLIRNRFMRNLKVGFYPVWSSMAEDSSIARAVQKAGLHWIGARPEAMDGLGKIEYKKFCASHGLPTAPFFTLDFTSGSTFDVACEEMAKSYLEKVKGTELEGKSFFVKSEHGGGGRGTQKTDPSPESVIAAIRKVATETKHVEGVYAEMALDLDGATLYQLEMEVDAGSTVDGGRLVYFNSRNQKMIELGFDENEIVKFLPAATFEKCVEATKLLARETGYDGRGTNEILIVKHRDGRWDLYCSEFNKRIQVEHKALSHLKRYRSGHLFNTVADQVMRSCGYCPPNYSKDLKSSGGGAVAHIRFIAPRISASGDISFPVGVDIEHVIMPKGFTAAVHTGQLYSDTDAQFGAALVVGTTWNKLQHSLQKFSTDTVVIGKNVSRDYFQFLQKFFKDPRVRDLSLGCNKTFDVLKNEPETDGRLAQVVRYLQGSVSRTLVNGYRSTGGVKNRHHPTDAQISEFIELRDKLRLMPATPKTPFLNFLDHLDEDKYFAELRDHVGQQGGAMVSVFPRDVQQECGGSESQLISFWSRLVMERAGFLSGHVGYEMGGAQYQTAEMNNISSARVMKEGILANLPTFSLTRSHWMNGLEKLSIGQVKYILGSYAETVKDRFHLPTDRKVIPWFPYNFHAGNVSEQDEVTGAMLNVGMMPVPNFSWDPRFTMDQFEVWVKRQFHVWEAHGRTLHQIRIKNAGQQKEWTPENVWAYVATIRRLYKERYGADKEPIVNVHNHNFNGLASHVAFETLKIAQNSGYRFLIFDTAPPAMTHNNNLVVAKALNLSSESREALHFYNESCHTIWQLTERFRDYPLCRIDPHTTWAGGTGSSDIAAAEKVGIARHDIEDAKQLGREVSGLGAIVTPYSQWSMIVGYTCYKQGLRNIGAVEEHIRQGGVLNLPGNVIQGLYEWKTLLARPLLVERLLQNYAAKDPSTLVFPKHSTADGEQHYDDTPIRELIRKSCPDVRLTREVIARVLHFGNFAVKSLKEESRGEDNNWLMRYPDIAYSKKPVIGKPFALLGVPITLDGIEDVEDTPYVVLTFKFEGQWMRVRVVDQTKAARISNIITSQTVTADPQNPNHVALFMPGVVQSVDVKVGHKVNKGDVLYTVNSMKMVTAFKATDQHHGKVVEHIYVSSGEELQASAEGSPLVMLLKPAQQ